VVQYPTDRHQLNYSAATTAAFRKGLRYYCADDHPAVVAVAALAVLTVPVII
jgi:hypothetical protein